jgi:uncharacterized protein
MQNAPVHFELPVNDPEKMSKFYSEAFGWKFEASPMGENQTYWMISTGPEGQTLNGGMYKRAEPDELLRIYVGDEDLEGVISRVERAGGSLINRFDIPGMVTGALMYDPERNVVGVVKSPQPQASTATTGTNGREAPSNRRSSSSTRKKSRVGSKKGSSKKK